jgi:Flavin-binding monooxygenase-like
MLSKSISLAEEFTCTFIDSESTNVYRLPRTIFGGKPLDLFCKRGGKTPLFLMNFIIKTLSWLYCGDLTKFGFPKPPDPCRAQIMINGDFVDSLCTGKVKYVGGRLTRVIGPHSVQFEDGSIVDNLDAIILATGYRSEFRFRKTITLRFTNKSSFRC